jgi:hypothetical protein
MARPVPSTHGFPACLYNAAGEQTANPIRISVCDRPDILRLIQEELAIAERGFCILVNGDNDRLDMLVTPPSRGAKCRTSASAVIQGGLSTLRSYYLRGSAITNSDHRALCPSMRWTVLS